MNNIKALVKLDFITIKPYFRPLQILMLAGLVIFMTYIGNVTSGLAMGMVLGAFYVAYPFTIGEKNNMDALYTTLSLDRRTVVTGRYLYALTLNVLVIVTLLALSVVITLLKGGEAPLGQDAPGTLPAAAVIFVLVIFTQSLQLPFYFKLGYAKAKVLTLVSYLPLMAGFMALTLFWSAEELALYMYRIQETLGTLGIAAAVALFLALIVLISYRLSLSFYKTREF